ncbi:hypothetical protein [Helicobacter vulpis]|uniref:hypothetical protein n=1 Tax=Helicobacter vulpis TaxID=2316076 RepID=UPI000EAD0363|nr:hypothetical protein [Helicobacter vulpis]
MEQKVHNVSYLAKVVFNLDKEQVDLVVVPKGAEVISVNLEITQPSVGNTLVDVGLKDAQDFFMNDVSAQTKGWEESQARLSSQTTQVIQARITTPDKQAQAILRVLYFLPSVISVEY